MRIFFVVLILAFVLIAIRSLARKRNHSLAAPDSLDDSLERNVHFFSLLPPEEKASFRQRITDFLAYTSVTGVGTAITDLDKILVAASAIIPIHHFPDWQYRNIREVLLYPDTFNKNYSSEGTDRNILGMVGEGVMNGQMILSLCALRKGFKQTDGHNTAIHEFVHLIDKADGAVDGVPEYLLSRSYVLPWIKQMRLEITAIRKQQSEINIYGATNDAEFFAVVSEYFFEKPTELQQKHPQLFAILNEMYT